MSTSHPVSQSWQTLTLEMQREPQRGDGPEREDRGGAGRGGPSLHQEKLPQPQIVSQDGFPWVCEGSDFNCISFFGSSSSHGSLEKGKGPEEGSGG